MLWAEKKGKESSGTESDASFISGNRDSPALSAEPSTSTATLDEAETDMEEGQSSVNNCTSLCCASNDKAYQPIDKQTLSQLASSGRNFQPQWYKKFPWLTICISTNKVYCLYCRFAAQHELITLIKTGEKAFTQDGFQKW